MATASDSMTAAGQALCGRLMPAVGSLATEMLAGFSAEEKATFLDLLARFKRNVDTVYTPATPALKPELP